MVLWSRSSLTLRIDIILLEKKCYGKIIPKMGNERQQKQI
jgi:hypothetical protein